MNAELNEFRSGARKVVAAAIFAAASVAMFDASAAVITFTDRASWEAAAGAWVETATFPSIAEGADVTSLTLNHGTVLNFDTPVNKRTIGSGWATWSGGYTGDVFATVPSSSVNSTVTAGRGLGLEMEPEPFSDFLMTLTLNDGTFISQTVSGLSGADFFGWVGTGVTSFNMSSSIDFAFGRFVEVTSVVPEPASLGLLAAGLLGLGAARRKAKGTAKT